MTTESTSGADNRISGGTFHGTVIQAGSITFTSPPAPAPLLGTIASPSSVFVGRDVELNTLLDVIRPDRALGLRVGLVRGPAGVGKSELVLHAAHAALAQGWFPGGVLSIDLQGYTDGLPPLTPYEALGRLMHRLGLPVDSIPGHVTERAAVYRHCLQDRSILVLLDNAVDSSQVHPLLPSGNCAALVTSRHRLPALDNTHPITLRPLPLEAACELLLAASSPDAEAETEQRAVRSYVRRIAAQCGGSPLALRVAAARVQGEPPWQFAELAEWLDDERKRLVELDDGERSVTAAFRSSYDRLRDDQRLLFVLCGLHPGPRLDIHAAAALADMSVSKVRRLMQDLRNSHLVAADGPRHYRLHDLLHAYARTRAHEDITEDVLRAATDRLIDYYLDTADRADRAVAPGRYRLPHSVGRPPHSAPDVDGREAALAWFTEELPPLTAVLRVAATTSEPSRCWILADALRGFFFHAKAWDTWLDTLRVALDVATAAGETRARGILHNSMGIALIELGRSPEAARHYGAAEELFEAAGDPHGVATSVENRAWVHQYAGDHAAALVDHEKALDVYRDLGARRNEAIVLRGMALAEIELGRSQEAIAHLTLALGVFRELGLDLDAAMALNGLGEAHTRAGEAGVARRYHLLALRQSRDCASVFEEARARDGLGALSAPVDSRRAAHHWRRALVHYDALGSPTAERIRARLEELRQPS
ncbi:tetratricopeptide repeat protein [Streptomyces sp. SP17KL33]|uniref:tetratricopeptide repeat protein n=1 Tax=Streptomyces sp. SP17KL33 TaxID=3002534 RepID=UPI002E765431|nr:tetratricopeptide repeat protein [Streptomyces sp. SP17KL33]MEE1830909.1 tetratricopeptide repeat protein [Streptomyces sp. SP17KL33]